MNPSDETPESRPSAAELRQMQQFQGVETEAPVASYVGVASDMDGQLQQQPAWAPGQDCDPKT